MVMLVFIMFAYNNIIQGALHYNVLLGLIIISDTRSKRKQKNQNIVHVPGIKHQQV